MECDVAGGGGGGRGQRRWMRQLAASGFHRQQGSYASCLAALLASRRFLCLGCWFHLWQRGEEGWSRKCRIRQKSVPVRISLMPSVEHAICGLRAAECRLALNPRWPKVVPKEAGIHRLGWEPARWAVAMDLCLRLHTDVKVVDKRTLEMSPGCSCNGGTMGTMTLGLAPPRDSACPRELLDGGRSCLPRVGE